MTTKSDVLIIGGGPVGLSCAYYLMKSGRKVTILDAKEIGKGYDEHGWTGDTWLPPLGEPALRASRIAAE